MTFEWHGNNPSSRRALRRMEKAFDGKTKREFNKGQKTPEYTVQNN